MEITLAIMYHSVSETSHPLQTEEQEIGIDPLQSYLNKPEEGEFCNFFKTLYIETLHKCVMVTVPVIICLILSRKLNRAT